MQLIAGLQQSKVTVIFVSAFSALTLLSACGSSDTAETETNVDVVNSIPIANAGADQTVLLNTTVTLNGTLSSDADNDALEYSWSIIQLPTGSSADLVDTTISNPTFSADVIGTVII